MNEREQTLAELVRGTRVFLLDLDGTVYVGDDPIGPMRETLGAIRASGRRVAYCTNNSSKTAAEYVQKLRRLGLYDARDLVYTSGMATAEFLAERYPGKCVYLVGTEALKGEFAAAGVRLCADGQEGTADVAVLAYDTTLTFAKLVKINELLVHGKPYIATHPDDVCPAPGVYPPDVGSFIQLLKRSSGREPDVICGKPYTVMGERLLARLGVPTAAVTMVGDRTNTDIRFGNNNGFATLLVLSGVTSAGQVASLPASDRPAAVAETLNDVAPLL